MSKLVLGDKKSLEKKRKAEQDEFIKAVRALGLMKDIQHLVSDAIDEGEQILEEDLIEMLGYHLCVGEDGNLEFKKEY